MHIDWPSVILGAMLSAIPAWLLTHFYYRRAERDTKVQQLGIATLLRALERQGLVTLAKDKHGNPTGGEIIGGEMHVTMEHFSMQARGTVAPPKD